MTWKLKHPGLLAGAIGGLLCMQNLYAQSVEDVYEEGAQRIQQAQAQQDEIDEIVEVTEDMFDDYQVLLREIEDLEVFNTLLLAQVTDQRRELADLYQAIDDAGSIERQILPLMTRMVTGLEQFISLDMPFLLDERMGRVRTARETLRRSDVTAAEQFRYILDAWLIEMDDYGLFGEAYTDEITTEGRTREVDILRIGRVALLYVTPDGSQAGAWDKEAREWVTLDPSYIPDIRAGIEAYRTDTPAMFMVPVPAPEEN